MRGERTYALLIVRPAEVHWAIVAVSGMIRIHLVCDFGVAGIVQCCICFGVVFIFVKAAESIDR